MRRATFAVEVALACAVVLYGYWGAAASVWRLLQG